MILVVGRSVVSFRNDMRRSMSPAEPRRHSFLISTLRSEIVRFFPRMIVFLGSRKFNRDRISTSRCLSISVRFPLITPSRRR